MENKPARIGLALCSCGQQLFTEAEWEKQRERLTATLSSRKAGRPVDEGAVRVMLHGNLCSAAEQAALVRAMKSAKLDRLVLAGCPPLAREDVRLAVAGKAGLPPSAVYMVPVARPQARIRPRAGGSKARKGRLEAIVRDIRRGLAAVARMPSFSLQRMEVEQRAVVIGGGPAGLKAAAALRELGVPVTVVEQRPDGGAPAGSLHGAELLSGTRLLGLEGSLGAFTLQLSTPKGNRAVKAGAVVVAAGTPSPAGDAEPFGCAGVVPLEDLPTAAAGLLPRREGRDLAIVLDYALEEGKASSERALGLALELQGRGGNQVHLLCRDLRVASLPLEKLYDQVREAGVDIVKHDGKLSIRPPGQAGEDLEIRYTDAILGASAVLACDLAGVSRHGVSAAADAELAARLGLSGDALGQLQENNLHLAPAATNRPGVFVVGSCRGQHYLPQIEAEARAAALAVHQLLAPGSIEVELSSPTVNADKCVLCLTCVRVCPYKAMTIDREKGAAMSLPEVCQRCGICAGDCPAKAIELPAWSDAVLLSQIEDVKP
jgi:heterodisulfide reductase subunit A-like polyferredoxin